MKEIINKKQQSNSSSRFLINNKIVTDKKVISDGFNSFFINVGPTLAKKIPSNSKSTSDFLKHGVLDSMYMTSVVEEEVINIIKGLKDSSSGWDDVSCKVLKATFDAFISPLVHVLNLSITKGVFPTEMKVARVIPIYKSGDEHVFSNYRPVSVLPVFSKVLERLMYNRLLSFINKHKVLYSFQFGFRIGHSPSLALIYLIDKVSDALEKGEFVLGLFLDFSKAFDTVNHTILFEKLKFYGIRGISLDWFKSYLSQREQFVEYNGTRSSNQLISCGVPQGSILGPLLFLIYINDLAYVSDKLFALLFADDSNMFLSGNDWNELVETMTIEMIKVVDWLRANKLSLNLKKTHFVLFRRKRGKVKLDRDLIVDNVKIEQANKTKFLGVMIDEYLSFEHHVNHIKGKVARGLGILYKAKRFLLERSLLQLYNSFIYPYRNYCIVVWGNTCDSFLLPLIRLQKKAMRILKGAKKLDHTEPIFKELQVLKLREIYVYSLQLVLFKFHHKQLPGVFENYFKTNSAFHNHSTRHANLLHVPLLKTKQASISVRRNGVRVYNHYYGLIDMKCSIATYKFHLKKNILEKGVSTMFN